MNTQIFVFLEISNGLAHTDVYRHILECRFTHFAPYVVVHLNPQKDKYLSSHSLKSLERQISGVYLRTEGVVHSRMGDTDRSLRRINSE